MPAELIVTDENGIRHALMPEWLRMTQNPVAPKYPRTGQTVALEGHSNLQDGEYIVSMVTEWEPPIWLDEDGRDIRISFVGIGPPITKKDWNGVNIRKAMI